MQDIFGRERFANHRDDMTGVGSFSHDCKTLFIGDLRMNRLDPNYMDATHAALYRQFQIWGPIENLRVIPLKNIAFVRYNYRAAAEFAKVAMSDQRIPKCGDMIAVKWAHADPNPRAKEAEDSAVTAAVEAAVHRRLRALGYSEEDLVLKSKWEESSEAVEAYPNTSDQFAYESCPDGATEASIAQETFIPPVAGLPFPFPGAAMPAMFTGVLPGMVPAHLMAPSNIPGGVGGRADGDPSLKTSVGPHTLEDVESDERIRLLSENVDKMQQLLNKIDNINASAFDVAI